MEKLSNRLTELSPERRQLLDRWLVRNGAPSAERAQPARPRVQRGEPQNSHKEGFRQFYDEVSQRLDGSMFGPFSRFLNFGYVPDGNPSFSVVDLPEHCLNKNSMRLVLEVIGQCDLNGRAILDVGCGRGGAATVIAKYFRPKVLYGIDLAPAAISFCQAENQSDNVRFQVGDAESLDFPDNTFDAVINIESSQCYEDITRFYREVFRVLVPGGHFLYTDAMPTGRFNECAIELQRIGLRLDQARDITSNVLSSCDAAAPRNRHAFGGAAGAVAMDDFLGAPGSRYYEAMKRGEWTYRIERWNKQTPNRE